MSAGVGPTPRSSGRLDFCCGLIAGFGFMPLIGICPVEDGRFVEHWDMQTLDNFTQVDAVPPRQLS